MRRLAEECWRYDGHRCIERNLAMAQPQAIICVYSTDYAIIVHQVSTLCSQPSSSKVVPIA